MPAQKFYYGIVTDTEGFKQYLGCDEHSGGYPYLTCTPVIHFNTKFLEEHKNNKYVSMYVKGEKYTLTIFEVNPQTNTMFEWGGFCKLEKIN